MYILVEDTTDYYSAERTHVVDTFEELYTLWQETALTNAIYEVAREISETELRAEQVERARVKMAKREAAMEVARTVLTPQQLKDLGLG